MSLPQAREIRFVTGTRYVPEYVAHLLVLHKIPTERLTYDQAIDAMNRANTASFANNFVDKTRTEHLEKLRSK
jgi:hypothetical protein